MAKKDYYLIIDTETTQSQKVADFGAILVDRKGRVIHQCAVLINGIYTDTENHPLFFTNDDNAIWDKRHLDKRYTKYANMLEQGTRTLASIASVNRWLDRIKGQYNPYVTAYNWSFDRHKCANTDIDVTIFGSRSFCLWSAAITKWGQSKRFRQFILDTHSFNNPTQFGNMTLKTNAEVMTRFVTNNPDLEDEPHTALEDALFYELPILTKLLQTTSKKAMLASTAYNWQAFQAKDAFKAI